MDLSKAFDTLNLDLLLAKLHAYCFSEESLKLIKSYLTNRWQRAKVNITFSSWSELLKDHSLDRYLGPLLLDRYSWTATLGPLPWTATLQYNDLFYSTESTNICNYADDTIFHACDSDLGNLINRLEHDSMLAIEWFESNYLKLNEDTI